MATNIQTAVPTAGLNQPGSSHLFQMSNGDLVCLWIQNTAGNGVQYAISQNNGTTWTAPASLAASLPTTIVASAWTLTGTSIVGAVITGGAITCVTAAYNVGSHTLGTATVGTPYSSGLPGTLVGVDVDWDAANFVLHVATTPATNTSSTYTAVSAFNTAMNHVASATLVVASNVASTCVSCAATVGQTPPRVLVATSAGGALLLYIVQYASSAYTFQGFANVFSGVYAPGGAVLRSDGHTVDLAFGAPSASGSVYVVSIDLLTGTLGGPTYLDLGTACYPDSSQPTLSALPSGNLLCCYRRNASWPNGEVFGAVRLAGTWSTPFRVTLGSSGFDSTSPSLASASSSSSSAALLYLLNASSLYSLVVPIAAAPNTPSSLSPGGGSSWNISLATQFSFFYSAPISTDAMSSYQARIFRTSDNALMWDSGQVTASCPSGAIFTFTAGGTLVAGTSYYWNVRAWEQSAFVSPYSTNATFLAVSGPTATLTAPTGTQTAPPTLITWSFFDPQGYAQASYQVQILDSDGSTVLYGSGTVADPAARSALLSYAFVTGHLYYARVFVTSATSGATSPWSTASFTTSFSSPDLPTSTAITPKVDAKGARMIITWDDHRTAGRDFAPQSGNYPANWVQLLSFDATPPGAVIGGTVTPANRTFNFGDTGHLSEGSGALRVVYTVNDAGTFTVQWTYAASLPLVFADGSESVARGDYVSLLVFCPDWRFLLNVYGELWYLVNGVTLKGQFGSGLGPVYAIPTTGSSWYHLLCPLWTLGGDGYPLAGVPALLQGGLLRLTPTGASTPQMWVDDLRLIRYTGQTSRVYDSGTVLQNATAAGTALVVDPAHAWTTNQFAPSAAPCTPYYVQDAAGMYWSVVSNTLTSLVCAPLQSQTVFPAGPYTLWYPDFVELAESDSTAGQVVWRHFLNEASEASSTDLLTFGQTSAGSALVLCQGMAPTLDMAGHLQVCYGGGGVIAASTHWSGLILRATGTNNLWAAEGQPSTSGWRIKTVLAGIVATPTSGTFAGMTVGTLKFLRAMVASNVITLQGSSDGTTWITATAPGSITGALATTPGYMGLVADNSARFDQVWLVRNATAFPSFADPWSVDILRRPSGPLNDYDRYAAGVTAPGSMGWTDWGVAYGQTYDYLITINAENGLSATTP